MTLLTSLWYPENDEVPDEPWVGLHDGEDLRDWGKQEEIIWNQMHRHREKYAFYVKAFDFLTDNKIEGDYFEFGCHRGRTFRMALTEARHHNLTGMEFLAFDSFEGLPRNEGDHGIGSKWGKGQLVTTERQFMELMRTHGLYLDQIRIIPGFYDLSLNADLTRSLEEETRKASFICLDCDLYESAVPVFIFIEKFLQEGSIVYIDDYWTGYRGNPNQGVSRAFNEHQERSGWKYAEYLSVGWAGKSFITYF